MVFDLSLAMRRKEEVESARLMDFAFRRVARATRMLAAALGLDPALAATLVATVDEAAVPDRLAALAGIPTEQAHADYRRCSVAAHRELTAERGDPTPHRLA